MAMGATAAVGMAAQIGGAFMAAQAAKKRKEALRKVAETPGVDTTAIGNEALQGQMSNFGLGSNLTNQINQFNRGQATSAMEDILPGYQDRKAQRLGITDAELRGEIPQDVQDALWDSSAGRAIAGGFSGSEFGRKLTARDFGLTSLDMIGRGMTDARNLNSEVNALENADMVSVADYLGVSPEELVGIRSKERSDRINNLLGIAAKPGSQDVWAKTLTDMGSQAAGLGLGSVMGGGGGSGGLTDRQIASI
jgi:hypothetical protein